MGILPMGVSIFVFDSVFSRIYFCSDREDGVYNIHYTDVEYQNGQIVGILSDTLEREVELDQVLSGEYDDKCPYIFGNPLKSILTFDAAY